MDVKYKAMAITMRVSTMAIIIVWTTGFVNWKFFSVVVSRFGSIWGILSSTKCEKNPRAKARIGFGILFPITAPAAEWIVRNMMLQLTIDN
ncbi:MAG: hypothetical protein US74_C0042G0010 [Parcubacteria group bacterium GW2011_GWA2_38_13]|nr:MAG: hypothetical protein US74_C0042G0010 [Parcubacteria group bacterium GW2011_GWA2_38_13]